MEGEAKPMCKFHQFGHCKVGPHCRHFHTKDTCSTPHCPRTACSARHPGPCKFFLRSGYCKFGSGCSYLHPINSSVSESENNIYLKEIQEEIKLVKSTLQSKEILIEKLQEKVEMLEKLVDYVVKKSCEKSHKCTLCDYSCKSETVLKRHMSRKHNTEQLRDYPAHESDHKELQLSPTNAERMKCFNENTSTIYVKTFTCELCNETYQLL